MTEAEGKEAEREWINFVFSRINQDTPEDRLIWNTAYAAACEAKRAELAKLLASRNAYALAMAKALEMGVFFPNKSAIKAELTQILLGHSHQDD